MNHTLQASKYVVADFVAAWLTWTIFFLYRSTNEGLLFDAAIQKLFNDRNYFLGAFFIPLFWVFSYYAIGSYQDVFRKARMRELGQVLMITFLGVIILFFTLILDDLIGNYHNYYRYLFLLLSLQFGITFIFRFLLTTSVQIKLRKRIIGFNTVIVGSNGNAVSIYNEIENEPKSSGNRFVGFVHAQKYSDYKLSKYLPNLGHYSDLAKIIEEKKVEEVIVAIERSEHDTIEKIISIVEEKDVLIKVIPDMQDFLLGSVKTTSIYQTPLIQINFEFMPLWQQTIKRLMDIVLSSIAMLILSPLYLFCVIGVKFSSKGPVFYHQERIGIKGKPFMIPKFRSMYVGAEKGTPQLSSKDDPRVTSFGRWLRKVRLDEIPQFFSVLKGDMSLVGPRPERQFYIDQITQRAPHYRLLLKVKPGITSWGQVKYGYAENVDQMIERLKYDILYLENMSLAMDLKIMAYTILTVLKGKGQ